MRTSDPNRQHLILVAKALGDLSNQVVFLGGATVGLFITDPAAASVRPTKDVDVVVEVLRYSDYQLKIGASLRRRGFVECTDEGAPLCAWKVDGIRVDVMPTASDVLGFTNPWYRGAMAAAQPYDLDGTNIRVVSTPYFLATKFVAFANRGKSDYYASHDLEDILAVVDGRQILENEIAGADEDVRSYVVESVAGLLASPDFHDALAGHIERGRKDVVLARLWAISGGSA